MCANVAIRFTIDQYDPDISFNTELSFHASRIDTLAATGVGKFVDSLRSYNVTHTPAHRDIGEFGDGLKKGLWFDMADEEIDIDEMYCVFIVRLGSEPRGWCWVLLVVPTGNEGEYRRIGVGLISMNWVTTVRRDVWVV